jgi:hypothetical protein
MAEVVVPMIMFGCVRLEECRRVDCSVSKRRGRFRHYFTTSGSWDPSRSTLIQLCNSLYPAYM